MVPCRFKAEERCIFGSNRNGDGKMKLTFTLPGSIRSKKNSKRIFKQGKFTRVLPSKAYVKWEEIARFEVSLQWPYDKSLALIEKPVSVNAQIYFKGPQPDLSGCLESVGDAMEKFLWKNDKQIISWDGSRLHHDLKNPRTELTVEYQ